MSVSSSTPAMSSVHMKRAHHSGSAETWLWLLHTLIGGGTVPGV